MERVLYDASVKGNLTVLLTLLQEDPLILDRVVLNSCDDMPLHVASMLGHVEFVKEILIRKPQLATECDSQRRLPLHIASAKGHLEIVRLLVSADPDTCLARDRDGRNPIHLAAIKGRCDVVKELVKIQPHAARTPMVQQETILHMCVKYNQREVLKLLVDTMGDHEFVNTKDADGNNILHLAVADKQTETINFLLLKTTIEVNASNANGETSMDILAKAPRHMKDELIIRYLTEAGAVEEKRESSFGHIPHISKTQMALDSSKYNKKLRLSSSLKKDSKNKDWLDKKRNTLMVVASLVATMAFQAGTNPPGGVWQEDSPTDPLHMAGYSIMASSNSDMYHIFLVCNTVGFVSTLSIILLLISGLPFLKNRFFLWILMIIMWMAVASMSFAYLVAICVLTPKPDEKTFRNVTIGILFVWIGLMTLLVAGHTIRLMVIFTKQVMVIFRKISFTRKKIIEKPIVITSAEL